MNTGDSAFLALLLLLSSCFFFLPGLLLRQLVLALCNLAFLATYISDAATWAILFAFVLSGYAVAAITRRMPATPGRGWFIGGYITALVAVFCVIKKYQFLGIVLPQSWFDNPWPAIVGISYMLFRQIHFVIDVAEEQIENPRLWDYLNYQLNLFALLAGPIQRFQDFRTSWSTLLPVYGDLREYLNAYCRLLFGVVKLALIGSYILHCTEVAAAQPLSIHHAHDIVQFAILYYGYPVYIFVNFSGYCDVVIVGAGLFGMKLPENFNRPYLARNMIDYWTRWHMSLSHWIRDYLYTPVLKVGLKNWPAHSNLISNAAYFIALFLAGVWHGSTWNFVIFGLLNGLGVATAKAYENAIIKRRGRKGLRQYLENKPIHILAVVVTLHFVFLTILFFPSDLHARLHLIHHFFFPGQGV